MPFPSGETQICRDCQKELPILKFSRNGRKDGYHRPECRTCQHSRSKEINPNYQYTEGAVLARANHDMKALEILRIKQEKLTQQKYQCIYCVALIDVKSSHLDHKTPLAKGGSNDTSNLQVLCRRCNGEKHSKDHIQYIKWLRDLNEHLKPDRRKEMFE